MYEDSKKANFAEVPQLYVMHERLLLGYRSNDSRAWCLNMLGNILFKSYQASGNVNDMNQCVHTMMQCGTTQRLWHIL
jgi:hypothetical protein